MENLYLCFIKSIGKNVNNENIYELIFTDKVDTFWGENFEYMPCCLCNELIPNVNDYKLIKTINTTINLSLIQNSCCHSMQDCMDGIIALAWEDISDYDEYPENGRLILHYGITYDETQLLLAQKNILFNDETN